MSWLDNWCPFKMSILVLFFCLQKLLFLFFFLFKVLLKSICNNDLLDFEVSRQTLHFKV